MNLLRELVDTARETIRSGYYRSTEEMRPAPSLRQAIEARARPGNPALIAEMKPAAPTRGKLVEGGYEALMRRFLADGAVGLSALTEPKHFNGSLALLKQAVATKAPVLMKDFILDEKQIDCAATHGASAILLIAAILPKSRLQVLTEYAHLAEREVLIECADRAEVELALTTEADLVGVNNRDLRSFQLDIGRTTEFTKGLDLDRPLVSLSGFGSRADVQRVADVAAAVLVGTSLLEGKTTVTELVGG